MTDRLIGLAGVAGGLVAVVSLATVPAAAQAPASAAKPSGAQKAYSARTPDGQPDLQGYWTTGIYTPLQRPNNVTKALYTPEEIVEMEKQAAIREVTLSDPGTPSDVHYDDAQFGLVRSQVRFGRTLRTSLIVDPPNGRIPPQIAEAQKRNADIAAARKRRGRELDAAQNMGYDDRCIIMSGIAPPMYLAGYLPNYQIIQSPGYVTILAERLHNARVIPLDGRPFPPSKVRSWTGVSRGRWEGNTLVVETRNSNGMLQAAANGPVAGQLFTGASEDVRVIERFTRVDAETIQLQFTVEDPKTWATPWTAELPVTKMETQGPFFEMACHEGNHALANMLGIARIEERKAASKKDSN